MLWLLSNWKVVAIAALVVAIPASFLAGQSRGDTQGYQRRIAEVAAADAKAELERKGDDAKLRTMDEYDLCVEYLRPQRMHDSCEQLRGVLPE